MSGGHIQKGKAMELKQEDIELVNNVQEDNCQDSLKELINRHSALCYNVYQKYGSTLSSSGVFFDDVVKEKDYVIYKSAMSYNPDKNTKFSTWVGNHARYHCLNLINANQKYVAVDDSTLSYFMENNQPHPDSGQSQERQDTLEYIFNLLSQLKDKRIKKVFELRYLGGDGKESWSKIGEDMGVSTQTAINLHDRGTKVLRKKMSSEVFFDKL